MDKFTPKALIKNAVTGISVFAAGILVATGAAHAEAVKLRIASVNPATTESVVMAGKVAERIKTRTDGRIVFQMFPSGQLGTTGDTIEQASQGQPVIGFVSASAMANFGVPEFSILEGPFMTENNEEAERLANSPLMQGFYDRLAENAGIRVLSINWFDGARHMIGDKGYPEPSDLKGVLMRVPPVDTWIKTFDPLGVVATSVEAGEVYSALSQGVVTAAEAPLTGLRASRWYEPAKHITLSGHFNLFTGWVMSEKVFAALSEEDQAIMLEEFRKGGQELTKLSEDLGDGIRKEFEAAGVTFHDANIAAYREATAGFYTNFSDWSEELHQKMRAAAQGKN
ncbi:TRAP transporter substrate-binding protein DctP [Pseudochrobactrum sp. MP213Fo]|uniref:TRAP transporter substrate-binding protein DctP n=1 Tax=Pseudochrobactrum sp. MP213Fo TaxID=3022250 RepID=UPI003BA2696F